MASSSDIKIFLSGGALNTNVNLSTGGPISNQRLITEKGFNNLWSDVSERQVRYGHKDLRIVYLKNVTPDLTFKNARVYWNESDGHTSIQLGRAGVNTFENSTLSLASVLPTDAELPPSLWDTAVSAADSFTIVQDFAYDENDESIVKEGLTWGATSPNGARVGIHISDSSSSMVNQKLTRVTVHMRRTGSAHGKVFCRIRDESDNQKAEMGSIESSTVPDAAGQHFRAIFTNTSNTYVCQVGDIISFEYPDAGEDEGSGSNDDHLSCSAVQWRGQNEFEPVENAQYDISGSNVYFFQNGGWRPDKEGGMIEMFYRAEAALSSGPSDPTNPDPNCDPNGPAPGEQPQQPLEGFLIMQDFNDLLATTGYPIGASENIFRRAVKVDNTTATILSNPIARMTFLIRRIGNPQGSVFCRIWNSSGTVMQTLGGIPVTGISNQATVWSQVPFTLQDNAYQMKVGDLIGIEFTTGTATDHIILAGWQWRDASVAAAAAEAGSPEATAVMSPHGVRMIYPNNGNFLTDWEIPSNSDSMRWDLTNPPINMEMTGYFFKSSPSSDTVSCKIRGGKHTDGATQDGCCYIPQFPCTGGTMQFEIECPHPDNHDCPTSGADGTALSLGQWHGYKAIVWNTSNGCVHIEAWQDKGNNSGSTPINQWEKLLVHDDCTGDCGEIDNPLLRPKGNTSQCTFRIDNNSGTAGKWLSVVEIQPGGVQQPGTPIPGDPNPPGGAKDVPGTSIARWTGTAPWLADDGGLSDLVYRAERFSTNPEDDEREDPIIIDPGTKRKPTSYDQGIVLPPLGPGDFKAIILERMYIPSTDVGVREMTQTIVAEVDVTTDPAQSTDPGMPAVAGVCPDGQYLDPVQQVCIEEAGSPGSTADGIILPSLPTTNYTYDPIDYTEIPDHNANGSFREHFDRGNRDLNSVLIGGYIQTDGPDDEEITALLGGGVHSPSNGGIGGRCYNVSIRLGGDEARIIKEDPHSFYHETGINRPISIGARQGHYTGVMFMKVNVLDRGKESVRIMAWVDVDGMNDAGTFTAGNQNWVKVLDETDNGNWYSNPWLTGALPGDSQATIRVDQQEESSYDAKFLFTARIHGPIAY